MDAKVKQFENLATIKHPSIYLNFGGIRWPSLYNTRIPNCTHYTAIKRLLFTYVSTLLIQQNWACYHMSPKISYNNM